ncbi:hypothetical protein KGF56_002069 [Candida oxycetoniae]|uniref:PWWP domain-containing protein n=1 Tax=Candida oxycetoniae TaxID=497107 RepID=A0AAI9SYH8_9ASCO|nr:uncharacterized protein KGF56_002069 [Candida oxycetoniae]KAI3405113.2 hypothetical protein KGF56_002069 [Candida oxycetoniae]
MSEKYPPKSIVLAKVKGYPPWPAMVLDESLLPQHIQNKKPKPKSKAKPTNASPSSPSQNNSGATSNVLPIKFFSDDTYIWININDLKPLHKDDIAIHFATSSAKRRKDQVLEKAFELASNPLDMEEFIRYGSNGKPEIIETGDDDDDDEEEAVSDDVEIVKAPPKKKQKTTTTKSKSKSSSSTTTTISSSSSTVAPSKPSKKSAQALKNEAAKLKKEEEKKLLLEYDSDWGLDDFNKYDEEEGNYIYDFEDQQDSIMSKIGSSAELVESYNRVLGKFKKWEDVIVEEILAIDDDLNEVDLDALEKALTQFQNSLPKIPRSIISKSKLLRILILNQRKPVASNDKDLVMFKNQIRTILGKLGIEVRENTEEELEAKSDNTTTAGSTKQSTPEVIATSRSTSEDALETLRNNTTTNKDVEIKQEHSSPLKNEILATIDTIDTIERSEIVESH